jgi:hypothetical protein
MRHSDAKDPVPQPRLLNGRRLSWAKLDCYNSERCPTRSRFGLLVSKCRQALCHQTLAYSAVEMQAAEPSSRCAESTHTDKPDFCLCSDDIVANLNCILP